MDAFKRFQVGMAAAGLLAMTVTVLAMTAQVAKAQTATVQSAAPPILNLTPFPLPTFPTPAQLEHGLVGSWRGALAYRDYQNNQRYELPMRTRISLGPDEATLTRVTSFDDGPKKGTVWITSVSLFDAAGTQVSTATFRRGRAPDLESEQATVEAWRDALHWTLVYRQSGQDNAQPAEIRITQTRDGEVLTVLKEVRPAGAADFSFRNETRLVREQGG